MFDTIKNLFGMDKTDYAQLVKDGAIILDVRTKGEFSGGHIPGALNISVDQLEKQMHQLKDKQKPIITCCASGMRSAAAKGMLERNGYARVFNGGGWSSLKSKL